MEPAWRLQPLKRLGPISFCDPRTRVWQVLGRPSSPSSDDWSVLADRFVIPGSSVAEVEYDGDQLVLGVTVARRQVELDGIPLLDRPADQVTQALHAAGHQTDSPVRELELNALGFRLNVALDGTVRSAHAVRADYEEVLARLSYEEPSEMEPLQRIIPCAVCGATAARIEVLPPGHLPSDWNSWSRGRREAHQRYRVRGTWKFRNESPGGSGGPGEVSPEKAQRIIAAFQEPLSFKRVHEAGLYDDAGFCELCDKAYCAVHWNASATGYGICPAGHGKSLDFNWSPDG